MFGQIQSWPTPEMFIRRTSGGFAELYQTNVNLSDFNAVIGQSVADGDAYVAGVALETMLVNGKQPIADSDSYAPALALSAFVAVTADNIGTLSDDFAALNTLSAFVAVTAQVGTTKVDDCVAGMALSAFVI